MNDRKIEHGERVLRLIGVFRCGGVPTLGRGSGGNKEELKSQFAPFGRKTEVPSSLGKGKRPNHLMESLILAQN